MRMYGRDDLMPEPARAFAARVLAGSREWTAKALEQFNCAAERMSAGQTGTARGHYGRGLVYARTALRLGHTYRMLLEEGAGHE